MSQSGLPAVADLMTVEEFKEALPSNLRGNVNQSLIDQINQTLSDPDLYESYRENLVSYASVLKEGKFKMANYIDAVKYVSHKLRGLTNTRAYALTFPDKMARWQQKGVSEKDQSSYISAYNKSKLVNLIYTRIQMVAGVLSVLKVWLSQLSVKRMLSHVKLVVVKVTLLSQVQMLQAH